MAQVTQPDRENVFRADSKDEQARREALIQEATSAVGKPEEDLDFQAGQMELFKERNEARGTGGITLAQRGVQIQAESCTLNTETKDGELAGNVVMTSPQGVVYAESAHLNIETETGDFKNASFEVEEGGYQITGKEIRKISEFEYDIDDSDMTTCRCMDGSRPWRILSSSCDITQEGYAHAYGTQFVFQDVPLFYTPYIGFPVKTKRAPGLLVPQLGMTNRDGFRYRQPIFLPLDESTDFTITPMIDTRSRVGGSLEGQRVFSKTSKVHSRFYYSNESRRGSNLRGFDVSTYSDPTVDTNRFGGFYKQQWRPDPRSELPLEFVADGHYTSDNLFIKEIEDTDIAPQQANFLTSTAVLRGVAFGRINAEARTEYNQMILSNQDLQFQRVPEVVLSTRETFRPFGFNPYGVKLITSLAATGTEFMRKEYYDGTRTDLSPRAVVPFHISNYVRGQFSAELHQTYYSLDDRRVPTPPTPAATPTPGAAGTPQPGAAKAAAAPAGSTQSTNSSDTDVLLDPSTDRTLPIFSYAMATGVERVYSLSRDSWLTKLAGLGIESQTQDLVRIKHTIEPSVQYTFVPGVRQGDLPLFDANDRYRERGLISYGVTSRLYGKFSRPYERSRSVEELAPSHESMPTFDLSSSLLGFGRGMVLSPTLNLDPQSSSVRELVRFDLRQTYDHIEDQKNIDPTLGPASDVNAALVLSPSTYFATSIQSNVDVRQNELTSFDIGFAARDDRDDALRFRYTYFQPTESNGKVRTSQIEGNLEVKLHERLRAGYYTRYNETSRDILESRALLRFISACKCWSLDLGVSGRFNPDRQAFMVSFNFPGLGDVNQSFRIPAAGVPAAGTGTGGTGGAAGGGATQ